MSTHYKITVLLPTRGRTLALERSVKSIVELAKEPESINLLLAFDNDDNVGIDYFVETIQPWLDNQKVDYSATGFESLGYEGLNRYYNTLAKDVNTDWFFVWNDDAIMETQDWDQVINAHTGEFKLLAVRTHNDHPYSIFPIVPKSWYDLLGYFSRHQMIDAELSQVAYMLDLFERIDIFVTHDRADLTGNNADETDKKRVRFEGDPSQPQDFHNIGYSTQRIKDCDTISAHMKTIGLDTTWWQRVKSGEQYPWEKLILNDTNKQMQQFGIRMNNNNQVVSVMPDEQANVVRQKHVA